MALWAADGSPMPPMAIAAPLNGRSRMAPTAAPRSMISRIGLVALKKDIIRTFRVASRFPLFTYVGLRSKFRQSQKKSDEMGKSRLAAARIRAHRRPFDGR